MARPGEEAERGGTMLTEVPDCAQVPGEPPRRWFASAGEHLIVWYRPDGRVLGFQYCYGTDRGMRALTWLEERGYTHRRVDTGGDLGFPDRLTPILVPDGHFPRDRVIDHFRVVAGDLEPALRDLIIARMTAADL